MSSHTALAYLPDCPCRIPAAPKPSIHALEAELRIQLLGVAKTLATRLTLASSDEYLSTAQAIETLISAGNSLEHR